MILWGGWLVVTAVVFSFANGIVHLLHRRAGTGHRRVRRYRGDPAVAQPVRPAVPLLVLAGDRRVVAGGAVAAVLLGRGTRLAAVAARAVIAVGGGAAVLVLGRAAASPARGRG